MDSRERTALALKCQKPDRPPLGFFAIDSDTAEKVLGRPTFWRAKAKSQIALWQGRRDEVVDSWIKDGIELHEKLDIIDIVPVCCGMAGICPPKNYEPEKIRQVDESTWEDSKGRVLKYSPVTQDISVVHDPTVWTCSFDDQLNESLHAPDESIFEVVDAIIAHFKGKRFILGPYADEMAWFLLGSMERGLMEIALNPEMVKKVFLEKVKRANFLDQFYIRPGQDGILFGTDVASNQGPLISPQTYRTLFLDGYKERIANVKSFNQIVVRHACGNNWQILDQFVEAGIDCYQSIQATAGMDIVEVAKQYGHKFSVWGGVNVETMINGSPEDVRREVRHVMENLAHHGGFILGTSHSVAVGTKYENFMALLDEYSKFI